MNNIKFKILTPDDDGELIADWYLKEWNIPMQVTIKKIKGLTADASQVQVVMTIGDLPVATGGLYNHVALLDKEPKFKVHKHWLALMYTVDAERGKGFGALLCNYIQQHAKGIGLKEIFLFTHTAESLYKRLGWQQVERLLVSEREIVIMKKEL